MERKTYDERIACVLAVRNAAHKEHEACFEECRKKANADRAIAMTKGEDWRPTWEAAMAAANNDLLVARGETDVVFHDQCEEATKEFLAEQRKGK